MSILFYWPRQFIQAWNDFFFASRSDGDLWSLGLFRAVFALVMLFCYLSRVPDLDFFFSDGGILPFYHLASIPISEFRWTLLRGGLSDGLLHGFHWLFLASLLSLSVGFFSRISALVAYILQVSFLHRNMGVVFGVDMISTYFFFYLIFTQSGARLSVDALWRTRRGRKEEAHGWLSHVALRLMQLQLCVVYAFSGWEKLKGTRWWDGSALWDVLSIGNMQRWDLSFVSHAPLLLALSVYVVLLWEIYFPVLIWLKKFRLPMLFFGLVMHVKIIVFMNLPSFGAMMISLYILFLHQREVLWLAEKIKFPMGVIPKRS